MPPAFDIDRWRPAHPIGRRTVELDIDVGLTCGVQEFQPPIIDPQSPESSLAFAVLFSEHPIAFSVRSRFQAHVRLGQAYFGDARFAPEN